MTSGDSFRRCEDYEELLIFRNNGCLYGYYFKGEYRDAIIRERFEKYDDYDIFDAAGKIAEEISDSLNMIFNGQAVYIGAPSREFTVGQIYNFKDGKTHMNGGGIFPSEDFGPTYVVASKGDPYLVNHSFVILRKESLLEKKFVMPEQKTIDISNQEDTNNDRI